jgi:hypothetical protein
VRARNQPLHEITRREYRRLTHLIDLAKDGAQPMFNEIKEVFDSHAELFEEYLSIINREGGRGVQFD